MSSANVCVHVAAPVSCCAGLQGLGVANCIAPSGTSHISFRHAAEAVVNEYMLDEQAHLLAVFLSLTDIVALPPPASLSLRWDPGSQSASLSVCDSDGHPIVVAQPSSISAELSCTGVSVTDVQPSPMDSSPMASVGSSVDPHAESLRCSADHAPVSLLSCSMAGQVCRTADAQPQHPLQLGQCPPTNLMFALLGCAEPAPNASCNDRLDGISQSQHDGLAGTVGADTSRAQIEQHWFHLHE